MKSPTSHQIFTYTAKRGPFLTIISVFGGLMAIESSVFHVLIIVLISNALVKWSLAGLLIVLTLFLPVGIMLSPLCTKHRLTQNGLRLQYGHLLDVTIPRTMIKNAQVTHEYLSLTGPVTARYDAQKQRITACFSEQGQILLTLTEPLTIKLGRQAKVVRTILLNCDKRDEFLAALQAEVSIVHG